MKHAHADAKAPVRVCWLLHGAGAPDGCVLLSWYPRTDGTTEVEARLGLAGGEVTLAAWPSLCGDWARVVHPTLHEVLGLHAAMSLAKDALRLANALLDSR
ncbi:esterase [Streptomyces diacarni]|uniref:esterase n=1 Tax=Streptomyces TaxID=1883 RepID=UPI001319DC6C|nr:esterase [Streptomyces sp. AA1529]